LLICSMPADDTAVVPGYWTHQINGLRHRLLNMTNIDFEQRYQEAIAEMLGTSMTDQEGIPTLPELMEAIKQGTDCEQIPSPTFEAFFVWWDTFTAYDQMDTATNAADQKPILKVAYEALKASGDL